MNDRNLNPQRAEMDLMNKKKEKKVKTVRLDDLRKIQIVIIKRKARTERSASSYFAGAVDTKEKDFHGLSDTRNRMIAGKWGGKMFGFPRAGETQYRDLIEGLGDKEKIEFSY